MDDFDRNVWCLLGLPYDALDFDAVIGLIDAAIVSDQGLFISTPNLNFSIAALQDSSFRDTVINSDLSLLDGMPLLWIARLLGIAIPAKLSGSDLFERLMSPTKSGKKQLRIFFLGGEAGVAEQACRRINDLEVGIVCVGFLDPGFGSVEELSSGSVIDTINAANADFLVIALGAKKGQLWIDRNRARIHAPIVCHLGAVINFVAGNVKRAPVWMQRTGLEWTWRIAQEPNLWRRYLSDGLIFSRLLLTKILPYAMWKKINEKRFSGNRKPVNVNFEEGFEMTSISISGGCFHDTIDPLRLLFSRQPGRWKNIDIDLSSVPVVDSAFIGLCLILLKNVSSAGGTLSFSGLNPGVKRVFHWNCVEFLL